MDFLAPLKNLPRVYWTLWTGALVNRLGGFVVPFLAIYLTTERKMPVADAGFIVSLFGAGSLAAGPIGGWLADRVGRRFTMVLGLSLGALSMIHLAYARSPAHIGVATLLLGLWGDLYRPGVAATISDVVKPEDRVRAFGTLYWAINLGFSCATIIAGSVSSKGFFWLFWGDALTSLIFAGIIYFKVPETRPVAPAAPAASGDEGAKLDEKPARPSSFAALGDHVFVAYVFLNFLISTVFSQSMTALPLDLKAHGITSGQFGVLIGLNGILIVLLQPFILRLSEGRSTTQLLMVGILLTGFGFGACALVGVPPFQATMAFYASTIVVWTLGEIVLSPVGYTVVAEMAPTHLRGSYQGLYQMGWGASGFAAPAAGAYLLGHHGSSALWLCCLGTAVVAALGQLALAGPRKRRIAAARQS